MRGIFQPLNPSQQPVGTTAWWYTCRKSRGFWGKVLKCQIHDMCKIVCVSLQEQEWTNIFSVITGVKCHDENVSKASVGGFYIPAVECHKKNVSKESCIPFVECHDRTDIYQGTRIGMHSQCWHILEHEEACIYQVRSVHLSQISTENKDGWGKEKAVGILLSTQKNASIKNGSRYQSYRICWMQAETASWKL